MSFADVRNNVRELAAKVKGIATHELEVIPPFVWQAPGGAPETFAPETSDRRPVPIQSVTATQENHLRLTLVSAWDLVVTMTGLMCYEPSSEKLGNLDAKGVLTPIGANGQGLTVKVRGDKIARSTAIVLGSGVKLIGVNIIANLDPAIVYLIPPDITVNSVWAILQIFRFSSMGSVIVTETLVSAPLTLSQPATLGSGVRDTVDTAGYPRVLILPSLGAGFDPVTFGPGLGARWELLSVRATLNASAAVGNRTPVLLIQDSNFNIQGLFPVLTVAQAGMAIAYQWNVDIPAYIKAGNAQVGIQLPRLLLDMNTVIAIQTAGLDAGDVWSQVVVTAREWLEPNIVSHPFV